MDYIDPYIKEIGFNFVQDFQRGNWKIREGDGDKRRKEGVN